MGAYRAGRRERRCTQRTIEKLQFVQQANVRWPTSACIAAEYDCKFYDCFCIAFGHVICITKYFALLCFVVLQESDKEEMKEILEMKRVHDRLAIKRQKEREQRALEKQLLRDKFLGKKTQSITSSPNHM